MARITVNQWRRAEGLLTKEALHERLEELGVDSVCPGAVRRGLRGGARRDLPARLPERADRDGALMKTFRVLKDVFLCLSRPPDGNRSAKVDTDCGTFYHSVFDLTVEEVKS